MTADENKALIRQFYDEVWHSAGPPALDTFIAEHLTAYRQSILLLRGTFRNLHWTIDTLIAEGDLVAERWTMRGTHKLTATPVVGTGASFFRIADGKIVEHWAYSDPDLQRQLDALPTD